jgi:hypothetical protein
LPLVFLIRRRGRIAAGPPPVPPFGLALLRVLPVIPGKGVLLLLYLRRRLQVLLHAISRAVPMPDGISALFVQNVPLLVFVRTVVPPPVYPLVGIPSTGFLVFITPFFLAITASIPITALFVYPLRVLFLRLGRELTIAPGPQGLKEMVDEGDCGLT